MDCTGFDREDFQYEDSVVDSADTQHMSLLLYHYRGLHLRDTVTFQIRPFLRSEIHEIRFRSAFDKSIYSDQSDVNSFQF